jgi:hypothetical protein
VDFNIVKLTINGTKNFRSAREIPLWSKIHLYDGNDPEWFEQWIKRIPSTGCGCAKGFDEILQRLPPEFSSPKAFFERSIDWHNAVNAKLEYDQISLETAYLLWRHRRPKTDRTRCVVTVATGKEFRAILDVTRPSIRAYAEKCNADFIELTNETATWWGFEKFRTQHFVRQYDETVFIDADCVINPSAPSIFGRDELIAMHDDYQFLNRTDWIDSERSEIERTSGVACERRPTCLNSGVVYCRKDAEDLWSPPSESIVTSHTAEQLFVEQSAFRLGYSLLRSEWNWQFYFKDFWEKAPEAWIVHFATSNQKIQNAKRMLEIWGEQN